MSGLSPDRLTEPLAAALAHFRHQNRDAPYFLALADDADAQHAALLAERERLTKERDACANDASALGSALLAAAQERDALLKRIREATGYVQTGGPLFDMERLELLDILYGRAAPTEGDTDDQTA